MKAILLAAGKGARLGKLTETSPKCILPVGGKSMLEHWFYLLSLYNVTDVLINTHYLANKVVEHCSNVVNYGIRTTFVFEKDLLGTAKTLFVNKDFVKDERLFLVINADTWMQVDLRQMIKFHKKRKGIGTLGLYRPKELKDQGCVKVEGRKIVSIEEKSSKPLGQHAFAGVMVGTPTLFKFYQDGMTDLARDLLPVVKEGLNPYFVDGLVLDIGTPERYQEANQKIKGLGLKSL